MTSTDAAVAAHACGLRATLSHAAAAGSPALVACLASRLAAAVRGARRGWLESALAVKSGGGGSGSNNRALDSSNDNNNKKKKNRKEERSPVPMQPLAPCVEFEVFRALEWCSWVCLGGRAV